MKDYVDFSQHEVTPNFFSQLKIVKIIQTVNNYSEHNNSYQDQESKVQNNFQLPVNRPSLSRQASQSIFENSNGNSQLNNQNQNQNLSTRLKQYSTDKSFIDILYENIKKFIKQQELFKKQCLEQKLLEKLNFNVNMENLLKDQINQFNDMEIFLQYYSQKKQKALLYSLKIFIYEQDFLKNDNLNVVLVFKEINNESWTQMNPNQKLKEAIVQQQLQQENKLLQEANDHKYAQIQSLVSILENQMDQKVEIIKKIEKLCNMNKNNQNYQKIENSSKIQIENKLKIDRFQEMLQLQEKFNYQLSLLNILNYSDQKLLSVKQNQQHQLNYFNIYDIVKQFLKKTQFIQHEKQIYVNFIPDKSSEKQQAKKQQKNNNLNQESKQKIQDKQNESLNDNNIKTTEKQILNENQLVCECYSDFQVVTNIVYNLLFVIFYHFTKCKDIHQLIEQSQNLNQNSQNIQDSDQLYLREELQQQQLQSVKQTNNNINQSEQQSQNQNESEKKKKIKNNVSISVVNNQESGIITLKIYMKYNQEIINMAQFEKAGQHDWDFMALNDDIIKSDTVKYYLTIINFLQKSVGPGNPFKIKQDLKKNFLIFECYFYKDLEMQRSQTLSGQQIQNSSVLQQQNNQNYKGQQNSQNTNLKVSQFLKYSKTPNIQSLKPFWEKQRNLSMNIDQQQTSRIKDLSQIIYTNQSQNQPKNQKIAKYSPSMFGLNGPSFARENVDIDKTQTFTGQALSTNRDNSVSPQIKLNSGQINSYLNTRSKNATELINQQNQNFNLNQRQNIMTPRTQFGQNTDRQRQESGTNNQKKDFSISYSGYLQSPTQQLLLSNRLNNQGPLESDRLQNTSINNYNRNLSQYSQSINNNNNNYNNKNIVSNMEQMQLQNGISSILNSNNINVTQSYLQSHIHNQQRKNTQNLSIQQKQELIQQKYKRSFSLEESNIPNNENNSQNNNNNQNNNLDINEAISPYYIDQDLEDIESRKIDNLRKDDGLILCEQADDASKIELNTKQQIKALIKKGFQQEINEFKLIELNEKQSMLNTKLTSEGILYMVLTDKKYPVKLSSMYLDEIQNLFQEEMKKKFGTSGVDFYSKIQTIEEAYAFISFDRQIKKKNKEYQDIGSNSNIQRLKNDLYNLQNTMTENIDLILDRDKTLNQMGNRASQLKQNTHLFKDRTEKLKWQMWFQSNMVLFIVGGLIFLFILFKFLF
ncbi:Longin-like domain [Pseudocohnilembus persalinus]|uniref:Longin-like domain n=1 Tax=Pseudocohnilembus persalinus TaxID=266149 RepID=A0A0V0R4Y0_PSEPJ|nr:Longin-like domain [Pseudocohnilembus persalinus]|eukprot:KRX09532.1 Longin-like domain [Pseudocohnilembus persalinus]